MTQKASNTGAFPMPGDGMRRLSPQNALQRARAMACMRERSSQCQGQVHVNLFFDGTGNNRDWEGAFVKGKTPSTQTQLARSGHSNVARLFDARIDEPGSGFYNFYIPGVGTPFREIGDSGSGFLDGTLGAATARWGADRINWGIIQVFNALYLDITEQAAPLISDDDARILANTLSQTRLFEGTFRRILFDAVSHRLERAIAASQRKVKSINIAVFGFSRGAAQARAFVHWLFEIVQPWNNGCGHNLAGVPMQLSFLGLFDTVASVGISNMLRITDGRYAWASGDLMSIHPDVQKCAHFVALHEQRINFPVELAGDAIQVFYPGMHSDVGGGYTPGSQGKDYVNGRPIDAAKLSQITLLDMHHEAIKAGVPLLSLEEIKADAGLALHFACHPQLIADYNTWLAEHGIASRSATEQIRAHARQYVQWKGMRLASGQPDLLQQPFFKQAHHEDQTDLKNAQHTFSQLVDSLTNEKEQHDAYLKTRASHPERREEWLRQGGRGMPPPVPISGLSPTFMSASDLRELFETVHRRVAVPPAATTLFDRYVHDSLAGFYIMKWTELNAPVGATNGYLRYRTLYSASSQKQQQVCADPLTTSMPPVNVPHINQVLQSMGNAFRP